VRRLIAALGLWVALVAAVTPRPGVTDPHLQTVHYDPDEVVVLTGALGWQIMLEFGPDERIENVSIGDALAWQVVPNKRAKMLFLKPLLRNGSTNMTVVTSRRQYAFSLGTGPRQARTPWIVRFQYPQVVEETLPEPPPPPPPVPMNFSYAIAGDAALVPTRVWDDGRQTYFEFAEAAAIPAIFLGPPGKSESIVNVSTRGRVSIVQQLGQSFTLRAGKGVATVTKAEQE